MNAQQRHMQAMMAPNSTEERAITSILNGLDAYVRLLREQKRHIAPELHSQLTAALVNVTRATLNLTDGPLGRLDCALLRRKLGEIAGIDLDSSTVVQLHDATEMTAVTSQESAFHG